MTSRHQLSRRQLLVAGLALGTAACGTDSVRRAAAVRPAGSDLGAIEHVVFLMHENRSFDHYFGTYRGVRGFDDHPAGEPGVFSQAWPDGPRARLEPFHLDTATTEAECTTDLSHAWTAQRASWHGGAMDRFLATHVQVDGAGTGPLTMGYYTRADLPFWYAVADAFTICDGYHCSVMGPTHPNRLHALSGTLDPAGRAGGPVVVTNSDPRYIGSATWSTMPEVLEDHGISWKVYNPPGSLYQPSDSLAMAVSDNVLLYFRQHTDDPSSPLYQKAFGPLVPTDLARDVATGALPQVSWIIPPLGHDEHPPAPPAAGMAFASQVLDILTSDPSTWSKTVLFVMYDENDGFFDHVRPPTAPAGTPGEYLTVDPLPSGAGGVAGPIGLGFRVPLLVVSPFSRGGYVCSDTFDHTSQLRFLETRFGVPVPNLSAWRRSVTGDLTATVDPTAADRSVPSLPRPDGTGGVVASECSSSQLVEVDVPGPPYPVPGRNALPSQEPGSARRR